MLRRIFIIGELGFQSFEEHPRADCLPHGLHYAQCSSRPLAEYYGAKASYKWLACALFLAVSPTSDEAYDPISSSDFKDIRSFHAE